MKKHNGISLSLVSALSILFFFALPIVSNAQQVISYQGIVTNNGTPLQGAHSVAVAIYTSATGGTAIYQESENATFTNGLFNILIGATTPLPVFDAGDYAGVRPAPVYYVGITIDGGTELSPRTQLGASPTAFSSRFADSARTAGAVVRSLNNLAGSITLTGGGGTTITSNGQTITISSSGGSSGSGIQGVQNTDGTINITSPNGPVATLSLADASVSTAKLADGAVTTAKIAANAVTNTQIGSGTASNGKVLTANGSGGTSWATPPAFSFPYSQTLNTPFDLLDAINSGIGSGLFGSSAADVTAFNNEAGVKGVTTNASGVGVLGVASDGHATLIQGSGVEGSSANGNGVVGTTNAGIGVDGDVGTTGVAVHGYVEAAATTARAGLFETTSSGNTGNVLEARCLGTGEAGYFHIDNAASTAPAVDVSTAGTGSAIIASTAGGGGGIAGVRGTTTSSTGDGLIGYAYDLGTLGTKTHAGVVGVSSAGWGVAGEAESGYGVEGSAATTGTGVHGTVGVNATTAEAGLFENVSSTTTGTVLEAKSVGSGRAGYFHLDNTSSTADAVYVSTSGSGVGLEASATVNDGVYGHATTSGTGVLGSSNSGIGVYAISNSGNGLVAVYNGTGTSSTTNNNIAIFQDQSTNKARIDNTGKGFFDGGTQASGADVAEEFNVTGPRASYAPGDVLVISRSGSRLVQKCHTPYSRLVVGVYATKPGVTLTDLGIDADESARVPMGVIGVIPTKVTTQGGAIHAGDLLVTSSTPGCAMKADLNKLKIGEALGKALENYSGKGIGKIEVLVGKY